MSVHWCSVKNNVLPTVEHEISQPVLRNCEICERLSGFSTGETIHSNNLHTSNTSTEIEAPFVIPKNANLPDVVLSCTSTFTSSKLIPEQNSLSMIESSTKLMPERIGRLLKEVANNYELIRIPARDKCRCAKLSWTFDGENILRHLIKLFSIPIEFCHRMQMR
ncbi:uncharacterized protein [Parasteatoda tepidariorum]|uniref:uncharacterized protein n=1 Tax=Parasteatoda tepidariorum TaxID=114398 RepID=UPI0039BCC98B